MKFYTNVQILGDNILYIGYHNGRRIQKTVKYEPYLFIPSKKENPQFQTIEGKPVDKIKFKSIKAAKEFTDKYKEVANFSIYGMNRFVYPFINDAFPNIIEYDISLLKIVTIDIETMIPKVRKGFEAMIDAADQPITAISIRKNDEILVFGYKEKNFVPDDPLAKYIHCKDEWDMLNRYLQIINSEAWIPDVYTGWNIEFFDIPYMVNRITKVLGAEKAKTLSPWKRLINKRIFIKGKERETYVPQGISILDYQQLYRKFTYNEQESYALNHIAKVELNEEKIDYSEYANLNELYEKDYAKFLNYNIHDINLVHRLEVKMRLIELIITMSYDAKINFADSLGAVLPWEVVIHNHLLKKNIVVPYSNYSKDGRYIGAYVKEPKIGFSKNIVSFDLTSLYPHLIIQYNISQDTFYKIIDGVNIEGMLNKNSYLWSDKYSITAGGALYSNAKQGFLPELMEFFFNKRQEYKKQLKHYKKLGDGYENEVSKYETAQKAIKIFLNSAYGALANNYCRFYSLENAEAITLSGQLSIKWVERDINFYLNKFLGTENKDYIIAMDTDSVYIELDDLVKIYKSKNPNFSEEDVINLLDKFGEEKIAKCIKASFEQLAMYTNAYTNAMQMNREIIATKGVWKAKKMYALRVVDSEGFRKEDLKIMGMEAVRSTIPQICRDALKDSVEIILTKDNDALIEYITKFKKKFFESNFESIAFPRGVNGVTKYKDTEQIYTKGTPIHTKGCLIYNHLIEKDDLPIEPIYDGDKIKYTYLKVPNPTKEEVIASPGPLPKELGLDEYIDVDMQFEKTFIQPLQTITNVISWNTEKTYSVEDFFE